MNRKLFITLAALATLSACQSFKSEVQALLSESGAKYKITNITGGLRERKMYCDIQIKKEEINKLIDYLELDQPLSGMPNQNCILYLSKEEELDNLEIEKLIDSAFGYQLWVPSRHGFAGAFLIYIPEKELGRLWLSIAYG
jgi:hypothetical protein